MPDVLIHGASSFIGRHFVRLLARTGQKVCILARQESDLTFCEAFSEVTVIRYSGSIERSDPSQLRMTRPVFYEFSWKGVFGSERNDPDQLLINIPMMMHSVKFARDAGATHWIGIGSQAEYGNINKKISESDPCQPTTLYGKSKLLCSGITAELCKAFGMDHSWLRLFSVYGPDDNHEWLIQYLIRKMMTHEEIKVTMGEQKWDYLYIDDITRLLMFLINKPGVGIANLGSGSSVPVREIIETLRQLTSTRSNIHYGAVPYRPDQVMFMEAEISRITKSTGWTPEISLQTGLRKTVEYLHRNLPA